VRTAMHAGGTFHRHSVMKLSPPVEYSVVTQSSNCLKETRRNKPTLRRAPAPPCMPYVRMGTLGMPQIPRGSLKNNSPAVHLICFVSSSSSRLPVSSPQPLLPPIRGCSRSHPQAPSHNPFPSTNPVYPRHYTPNTQTHIMRAC
jgi:hypothetical protein